jgi:hypothetical protein
MEDLVVSMETVVQVEEVVEWAADLVEMVQVVAKVVNAAFLELEDFPVILEEYSEKDELFLQTMTVKYRNRIFSVFL